MRNLKFFLTSLLIISFTYSFSQQKKFGRQFLIGTELGLTGGIGSGMLTNKNIKNDVSVERQTFFTDKRYGLQFAISYIGKKPYSSMLSLYGEYVYNKFSPEYLLTVNTENIGTYNKTLNFKTADKVFALRYIYFFEGRNSYYGLPLYFDLGMSLSTPEEFTETNGAHSLDFRREAEDYAFAEEFNTNTKNLFIGIGFYKKFFNFGLRFYYGLDNMLADNMNISNDGIYDDALLNPNFESAYINYVPTKKLGIELKFEINLPIMSYGRCDYARVGFAPFSFPVSPGYFWKSKM